jgi:hypothetical protein
MSLKKSRFKKGIVLTPDTTALESIEGELKVDSADNKMKSTLGGSAREFITDSQAQTLTNKTLTSPVLNTGVSGTAIDTDGTLAANSDTLLASQKAVKTYADSVASTASGALTSHINDATDAHDASAISNIPAGSIASTDVQAAINELDGDIQGHMGDSSDAHDASAISNVPAGSISATDVQAAINELDTDAQNHISASTDVHGLSGGAAVVGTTSSQTLTNKTITGADFRTPVRLDAKQDTKVNLETYALTASNGQIVFATDEKQMYQVVDTELVSIGGQAIIKPTAGETLALRDLVYISTGTGNDSGRTAGRAYKVDATNTDRIQSAGFVVKAGNLGDVVEVQTAGLISTFSGLTAGKLYYASQSSPGAIVVSAPSDYNEWAIPVGLAASATVLIVNPVASADSETKTLNSFTIVNNQASAADVTGMSFDGATEPSFTLDYFISRTSSLESYAQAGKLRGAYNATTSTWYLSDDFSGQNSGVTFSITSAGQVQYVSSNVTGTSYVGLLNWEVIPKENLTENALLISNGDLLTRVGGINTRLAIGTVNQFLQSNGTTLEYTSTLLAGSGTVSNPSLSFTTDPDTGIYRSGTNQLSITTAGTEAVRFTSAGLTRSAVAGAVTTPTYSFVSDSNTGLYNSGADELSIATGGTQAARFSATGEIAVGAGSEAAPAFSFIADDNTGIYSPTANTVGIVTGGSERFRIASTGQISAVVNSQVGTDYQTTLYPGYLARAWVTLDTTLAAASMIQASGNVSSMTDDGVGEYRVNFTTAMPDTDYAGMGSALVSGDVPRIVGTRPSSTSVMFLFILSGSGTRVDVDWAQVAVFR